MNPLGKHVLIERDSVSDTSPGGIVIPTNAKDEKVTGTLIAKGELVEGLSMLQPGDRVLFNKYGATEVPEHEGLVVVLDTSVLLTFE